ncbi:unnamed protein product [Vitrella brassicaformis CCMP3155]|uniref:EamA domain-containing protein n=2 Tax=Vitrella brassicaformis TaxID=1169539 RepID=A0A0G4G216_VITBC|nr:unnamed protein product [Vitrella brassicaformis CCMP3155]|eukprot:CEM22112.1 unnamed protein product [Vitrella brassicaformis CCMP3155]
MRPPGERTQERSEETLSHSSADEEAPARQRAASRKSVWRILTEPDRRQAGEALLAADAQPYSKENKYAYTMEPVELETRRLVNPRTSVMTPRELTKELRRQTIMSPEFEEALKEENPSAHHMLSATWIGYTLQASLFFASVLVTSLSPNIIAYAKRHPKTGERYEPFIDGVLYVVMNLSLLVIMVATSVVMQGVAGLKRCFNIKEIMVMSPPAMLYGMCDVLYSISLSSIIPHSPTFGLKREVTALQWTFLLLKIMVILLFMRVEQLFEISVASKAERQGETVGLIIYLMVILIAIPAGVLSDHLFKKTAQNPFYIQMAQTACVTTTAAGLVGILQASYPVNIWPKLLKEGPFAGMHCKGLTPCGWNLRVWFMIFWLLLRIIFGCLVMKRLDAIWKSLADAVSTVVTYSFSIMIFGAPMGPAFEPKMFLACTLVITVIGYLITKIEPKEPRAEETAQIEPKEDRKPVIRTTRTLESIQERPGDWDDTQRDRSESESAFEPARGLRAVGVTVEMKREGQ